MGTAPFAVLSFSLVRVSRRLGSDGARTTRASAISCWSGGEDTSPLPFRAYFNKLIGSLPPLSRVIRGRAGRHASRILSRSGLLERMEFLRCFPIDGEVRAKILFRQWLQGKGEEQWRGYNNRAYRERILLGRVRFFSSVPHSRRDTASTNA